MQPIAMPLVTLALLASVDAPAPKPRAAAGPDAIMREFRPFVAPGNHCRDDASPANGGHGEEPRLERGPATPDMGQTIYAVDRRVDGCAVILVKSTGVHPLGRMQLSPGDRIGIERRR